MKRILWQNAARAARLVGVSAVCLLPIMTDSALAAPPVPAASSPDLDVLDVEKRQIVTSRRFPSDASPTCDVLVLGGGTGGIAAAEALAKRGVSVIIVEPTDTLGGQFTSQLVSVPDENSHIEKANGPSTTAYRALRERVRDYYKAQPDVVPGREKNIGSCWVSRVSGTPDVWARAIAERLDPLSGTGGRLRQIYRRHTIRGVGKLANGRLNFVDIVNLDTGAVTRIGAQFFLDATEDGSFLTLAGCPTAAGQEAKSAFNEAHAPDAPQPGWVQSFTYCFLVRWQPGASNPIVAKPDEYDYFKSLGEYTLDYEYSERGTVTYKMLTKAQGAGGPFWTYRRLLASSNFKGEPDSPTGDLALINWRGNDFHEEAYLGKPLAEQARILSRGREFARGFLYWLQTECPRDDGQGVGYPEIQPVSPNDAPGIDADGFALHPYVRESQRLQAQFMLNENHLTAPAGTPKEQMPQWGDAFPDSVGCALYAVDIHPTKGEPPLLFPALPYHIPLGSFLPASGPTNVLPAAKNIGASRLAAASVRMHPTEWLCGEVAGTLAAYCLRLGIDNPANVRNTPDLLSAFQSELKNSGITLYWSEILPPPAPPTTP